MSSDLEAVPASSRAGTAPVRPAPERPPRRRRRRGGSGAPGEPRWVALLYIAPAFAFFAAFVVGPVAQSINISFYDWDGVSVATAVGLDNYREVLGDEALRSAFAHSLVFVVFFSFIPVSLGLLLAALMSRHRVRGLPAFRLIYFLPQVVALVVTGIAWRWMYASDGVVNQLLTAVGLGGLTRAWLGDFTWALPAVGLIGTWIMIGLTTILFFAGIQKVDTSLYDAARVDGAGMVREFFAVTLPGLRAEVAVALSVTMIAALKSFDLVFVTTQGGPGTSTIVPAVAVYRLAFQEGRVGTAAAVAVVLAILIGIVIVTVNRVLPRPE